MLRMLMFFSVVAYALAWPAAATPYWVAYEGNDFPENEGWTRSIHGGGADRWIEDGVFTIDSTASLDIDDAYTWDNITDPGPGEIFVAEWRLRVNEFINFYDVDFGIARSGTPGHIQFEFAQDHVLIRPAWVQIGVEPGVFHTYRFESAEMDWFTLFIDDQAAYTGQFESQSFLRSFVAFGDLVIGAASASNWDFVRFGVVPEPGTLGAVAAGGCLAVVIRSTRRRTKE